MSLLLFYNVLGFYADRSLLHKILTHLDTNGSEEFKEVRCEATSCH